MAKQKHLDLLKQGVTSWNSWRKEHQGIQPDLRGANLKKLLLLNADFSRANLSEVDFRGAKLKGADFSEADLTGANLSKTILKKINFRKADLSQAILDGADLSQADLGSAKLIETHLSAANLRGINLSKAILGGADLSHADLREAKLFDAVFDDGTNLSRAILDALDIRGARLTYVDLSGASLKGAKLSKVQFMMANLSEADLREASLMDANLIGADLSCADLSCANLLGAVLMESNLSNARLIKVMLSGANLSNAYLIRADLSGADLSLATLVRTNLNESNLTDCLIYGISAWDVQLDGAKQLNLVITPPNQPTITVDNLKVAQFIYLLLNNREIRDVIDTITSKVVLILGRFTDERKKVLDALRDELRRRNYSPVLFDFEKPSSRDFTETVRALAHMSRFIIADLSAPRSIPQELQAIVPHLAVPVQPLLSASKRVYGMFQDFKKYPWVLPVYRYKDLDSLLLSIEENVIDPVEQKAQELQKQ